MSTVTVDAETAELEFQTMVEAMDLEVDEKSMSEEDLKQFTVHKNRILNHIMTGHLIVNDKGAPEYTPHGSLSAYDKKIVFQPASFAAMRESDKQKEGEAVGKTMRMLAAMTDLEARDLNKLKGRDMKAVMSIFALLMA